ncbi:FKBP-type peptidyl-prolyl cis-trans isomerase [Candidatus Pacearchaeota archaeon]|nr:FKBP-type peptidyl-prolyl cis-trans isomerase [Candidatus Pacearchaeota archaeon]
MINKKDFVELHYTGYSQGQVFDSNIAEDLQKLNPKAEAKPLIVAVGEGMVVHGFDKALEGKEIGKRYEIHIGYKEAFGERRRDLVKTIPLKVFTEKNVNPYPGLILALDDNIAKIIAVSGARVITDFNNPLAGKDLTYVFTINRKVTEEHEKSRVLFDMMFRFVPEFEVKDKIVVKGPKFLEFYIKAFNEKFKELVGKELDFELKENKEEKHQHTEHKHE